MPKLNAGPRTGLDIESALAKWVKPDLWARSVAAVDGKSPDSPTVRHTEWVAASDAAEADFIETLQAGDVVASAIEMRFGILEGRRAIEPSLWAILMIDRPHKYVFKPGDWRSEPVIYKAPEFFDPGEIPRNIHIIPAWLAYGGQVIEGTPELLSEQGESFSHSDDYLHIRINDVAFRLGQLQAKAVAGMHEALRSGNPWVNGKRLLEQIGSQSMKLQDIFKTQKGWAEHLIESDGAGGYRLRIEG